MILLSPSFGGYSRRKGRYGNSTDPPRDKKTGGINPHNHLPNHHGFFTGGIDRDEVCGKTQREGIMMTDD
jgi:hypothetical protein